MANTIPCPNPVCTHQFAAADLQSAAQLTCPKCGFRMAGKGPAQPTSAASSAKPSAKPKPAAQQKPTPKPAASPKPAPKPVANPPMATPIPPKPAPAPASPAPSPPMATPIPPVAAAPAGDSMNDGAYFNPDAAGPLVRPTAMGRRKFNWGRLLVVGFSIALAICLVVAGIGYLIIFHVGRDFGRGSGLGDGDIIIGAMADGEKVYKLVLPRSEWDEDKELAGFIRNEAGDLKAHSAYKHVDKRGFWFAMAVRDFGTEKPRDADLLRLAVELLEGSFKDTLELEKQPDSANARVDLGSGEAGDLAALKLTFKGHVKEEPWVGECYLFFHKGIGYLLFMAGRDPELYETLSESVSQKRVFAMSERKDWQEQRPPLKTHFATDGKLDITVPEKVWEKSTDAASDDMTVKLLLGGRYRQKDNRKNAIISVFGLPKQTDLKAALKASRDYVEKRAQSDNTDAQVVHAADVVPGQTEQGTFGDVGNKHGRMIDLTLKAKGDGKEMRYYLLAVVSEPGECYAIVCECAWDARQIWRQEFVDIMRTMRVR